MSRLRVPAAFSGLVRQFVADFERVTSVWVAQGWHTADEVQGWKELIKLDMQGEISVNPAIDPRGQGERIEAWCRTFRGLARQIERGVL